MPESKQFNLGPLDQIPAGEGRNFMAEAKEVTVFRDRSGKLFATQPLCPHMGGPLADGLLGNGTLICPLHERHFDLNSGECRGCEESITVYPVDLSDQNEILIRL